MPSVGIRLFRGVLARAAQLQAQLEMELSYPALDANALDLDTPGARMAVRRGELLGEQGSD